LGVEVQHIPGGCTSLCQPMDIGVAQSLKDDLKNQWESWMIKKRQCRTDSYHGDHEATAVQRHHQRGNKLLHGQLQHFRAFLPKW